VVFDSIYDLLDGFSLKDDAYQRYSKRLDGLTESKLLDIKHSINSKQGALKYITKEIDSHALSIDKHSESSPIYKSKEKKIAELDSQRLELERELVGLRGKVANANQIKVGKEEFLNLLKNASV